MPESFARPTPVKSFRAPKIPSMAKKAPAKKNYEDVSEVDGRSKSIYCFPPRICSRTPMGYPDPPRFGAPHQCSLGTVACYAMLTCALLMTSSHAEGVILFVTYTDNAPMKRVEARFEVENSKAVPVEVQLMVEGQSDNSVTPHTPTLSTENLLEDTAGLLHPLLHPRKGGEATHQRPLGAAACGSRFLLTLRFADDVIAFEGFLSGGNPMTKQKKHKPIVIPPNGSKRLGMWQAPGALNTTWKWREPDENPDVVVVEMEGVFLSRSVKPPNPTNLADEPAEIHFEAVRETFRKMLYLPRICSRGHSLDGLLYPLKSYVGTTQPSSDLSVWQPASLAFC